MTPMRRQFRGALLLQCVTFCLPRRDPILLDFRFVCGLHRIHFGVVLTLPFAFMALLRNALRVRQLFQINEVLTPLFLLLCGQPNTVLPLRLKQGRAWVVMFFCRSRDWDERAGQNTCQ